GPRGRRTAEWAGLPGCIAQRTLVRCLCADAGGVTYGSRWSERSERPPDSHTTIFSTPAGVAYQLPGGVNPLRDRCRGRKIGHIRESGGLALRARPPATVRAASSGLRAASPLVVLTNDSFESSRLERVLHLRPGGDVD